MSNTHRQKPQYPAFEVLWSCRDHRLPLQVRSFTSDSYRALKEREGKRERRQRSKNKRWHNAQHRSGGNECWSENAVRVPRMSLEPDGRVMGLDSDISLPPLQDESRAQANGTLKLDVLGSPRGSIYTLLPIESSSCSSAVVSYASPSLRPVSIHSGHSAESRQRCGTFVDLNHDESTPSTRTPDKDEASGHEAGNFEELPCDGSGLGYHAADSTPSVSPLANGTATGLEPGSSHSQIDINRSLRLAALQSHSKRQLGQATNVESIKPVDAEPLWHDSPRHGETVKAQPSPIRSSRKGKRFDSLSQIAWNHGLDEHLLHLRDVAQLNWQILVTYFPGTTPDRVRQRYQQLKKTAAVDRTMDDRSSDCHEGNETHLLSNSCSGNAPAPETKTHSAEPAFLPKRAAFAPRCPARPRRPNAQANEVEAALPSTHPVAQQRTSRCGRAIRHPFRHRPSEGYL